MREKQRKATRPASEAAPVVTPSAESKSHPRSRTHSWTFELARTPIWEARRDTNPRRNRGDR